MRLDLNNARKLSRWSILLFPPALTLLFTSLVLPMPIAQVVAGFLSFVLILGVMSSLRFYTTITGGEAVASTRQARGSPELTWFRIAFWGAFCSLIMSLAILQIRLHEAATLLSEQLRLT